MSDELRERLEPLPGLTLAAGPFKVLEDGTILDRLGQPICVLGRPEEPLSEHDIANGAAILALPELIQAVRDLLPYATACIGRSRASWPTDSVILQAEAALAKAGLKP